MTRLTSPGRSERPGHTWPPATRPTSCPSSSPQNPRNRPGLPGSLRWRYRPMPAGTTPRSPHRLDRSHCLDRAGPHRLSPRRRSHRLPLSAAGHHHERPCTGSLHVQAYGFASAPSAPPVTGTHWASATELQRPKLRKDSHLLVNEAARRTRGEGAPRGRSLGTRWVPSR